MYRPTSEKIREYGCEHNLPSPEASPQPQPQTQRCFLWRSKVVPGLEKILVDCNCGCGALVDNCGNRGIPLQDDELPSSLQLLGVRDTIITPSPHPAPVRPQKPWSPPNSRPAGDNSWSSVFQERLALWSQMAQGAKVSSANSELEKPQKLERNLSQTYRNSEQPQSSP